MSDLEVDSDFSENEPLVRESDRQDDPIFSRRRFRASRWQTESPRVIVFIVATVKFTIVTTGMITLMPVFRLIEDALCHAHYGDDSPDLIDELECKVDEVQSRLAYVLGFVSLVNSIMSLIVTYPYGIMADKIGRKPVILLSLGGMFLAFSFTPFVLGSLRGTLQDNPYFLMVGSLFQLIGGGIPVILSTLYAIAADVSSEQEKATSFLYLTFGATAGGLTGPILAGILMKAFGPWVPIYVSLTIMPSSLILMLFIPETLPKKAETGQATDQLTLKLVRQQLTTGLRDLVGSFNMIKNVNVPLILVTFLFQNARVIAYTSTLAQYVSKHFGWKLADTSLLLSPLGILNLVVLALLSRASEILMSRRFRFTSFGKDLYLTRVSTVLIIIGAVIEGFSHNIVIFLIGLFIGTFGAADSPLARATISHYVAPEFTSRLYALIGMVELLGSFVAGPVLAWLFGIGLEKKGMWIGLPWFYIALLSAIAWIALAFVRRPTKDMRSGEENDLGEAASDGRIIPA